MINGEKESVFSVLIVILFVYLIEIILNDICWHFYRAWSIAPYVSLIETFNDRRGVLLLIMLHNGSSETK